jgi:hypothetical protein
MKKIFLAVALIIPLASCTTTEKNASLGAATGAVVGGVVTGNVRGAAVGAVIGGAAGVLVSRSHRHGWCVYRDRNGHRYEDRCRR